MRPDGQDESSWLRSLGEGDNMPPRSLYNLLTSFPHDFSDKCGRKLRLRPVDENLQQPLLAMYLAFQPRNCFQGLPPIRDEVCTQWVQHMIQNGVNLAACSAGVWPAEKNDRGDPGPPDAVDDTPAVLGHAALFPIDDCRCEMLVVVSSSTQNLGLGTELVRGSVRAAREMGFERIWIPVAATNVRARHVYEKCGFQYVSRGLARELEMTCELVLYQDPGEGMASSAGLALSADATLPEESIAPTQELPRIPSGNGRKAESDGLAARIISA